MVKSLLGSNRLLLGRTLNNIRTEFIANYGDLAIENIDVADWEVSKILDLLSAQPFLTSKRLVIVQGLAANKSASDSIEKLLEAVSNSTDAVIVEAKIDKRSVLYKTLKKRTDCQEFAEIDARDAPRWLVQEAKLRGGTLSLNDATYLVARVGVGQQQLSSELDKLLLYSENVSRSSIDLLTEQAALSSIFELIEAAFSGNIKKALALYDDQRAQNVEPLAIEALFVWQLHILLLLKAAGNKSPDTVAAEAGISPYVAKKSAALAASRTFAQLKNYVQKLSKAEYDIKTINVDSDDVLKNFILLLGQ